MAYLICRQVEDYSIPVLREVVSDVLERSGLQLKGKSVLVKPNLLGPFPPESGVVTHPSLVRAVRDELIARGAKVMVGDNPGLRGYGLVERVGKITGAAEAAGECWVNLSLNPVTARIDSRYIREVQVSREVLEADILISLPKLKTHVSTVITGAIKNSYGFLVGGEKARLHSAAPTHDRFGELVVDVYALRPPDLVIMDGIVAMEGNGPSGGPLRKLGLVLAGDSGGAVDLAVCRVMGLDPSKVPSQRWAMKRGLSPGDLGEVELEGDIPRVEGFRLPSTVARLDPLGLVQRVVFRGISRPRFSVDRERCDGCASCARGCPAEAVTVKGHPEFDRSRCIGCYCCFELCPRGAIKIRGFVNLLRRGGSG
jgi:uncharacterized protein (DUF362 family)/NAD-dependent dihydropyrimidine dehydrogenase PreA subunit